ncbi:MAG: hypothetical protein FJ318_06330, partial [SAR202 cluster bacterium]|nr:hypothetical protein [SAR202 cluster bacterium]
NFLCTYHGWTFGSDGRLEYVPGEQEAYYGALNKEELGLVEARVDTYAGLIFACWDKEAPTLEAYLGDARWYLDTEFNRLDAGMIAYGPIKWMEPVNWKTPVDNCSDNYHVPISHHSSALVQARALGKRTISHAPMFAVPNPNHHVFVNGHSLTFKIAENDELGFIHGLTKYNQHIFEQHHKDKMPEVERRLGAYRARKVVLQNHSLFPNTVLGFRLALPRGPQMTEFWHFGWVPKDAPYEVQRAMRSGNSKNNGPAGLFEQDDLDNWRQVTMSSRSPIARKTSQLLNMGTGRATTHEMYPGEHAERYISEHNQRNFYVRWQQFMNADSWRDIPLEPMRARYEGTATLHG